ncbi:MAG: JAB domain-containing protein [Candidatus Cryosericum sp.]
MRDVGKEFFYVVLLDIRNKVINDIEVSRGSISTSVVDPADIVREVCIHHASRVVLVHNHPSGEWLSGAAFWTTPPLSAHARVTSPSPAQGWCEPATNC